MRVYDNISRGQSIMNGWKIIQTRWIDINKGDDDNPNYRSMMVGNESNDREIEGLFAAPTIFRGTPIAAQLGGYMHRWRTTFYRRYREEHYDCGCLQGVL